MTPERYQRASDLFLAARRRMEAERNDFLRSACADDLSLMDEVASMLEGEQEGAFLDSPAWACVGSLPMEDRPEEPPPERIGHYRPIGVLGRGGMGLVYRAEQDNPHRVVALKVIRAGLMSPVMLRRFEHEAVLLGRLKHPGIAQIYEAGTVDGPSGRVPFLAMEFVQGTPLLRHAAASGLELPARLELMARVCDAVQHAHQRGVIHRDLKPANILVESCGQPKLLDFGVARATDSDLRLTTLNTATGQLLGTLPYMSPEQVRGDPRELDTRSDVYALGVILYELVAGRLPYDLSTASVAEAARIVRDEAPARPSALRRELRGDAEAVLLKALEKERARRYQSAADLAADLRALQRNGPVSARRNSALYQFRKFAIRNRAVVAAGILAIVALAAAATVSAALYVQSDAARRSLAKERDNTARQRDRALEAEALAQSRLAEAERQAAKATRTREFLVGLFDWINPDHGNGAGTTVREVADAGAARLGGELNDEPEVKADALETLGRLYAALTLYDRARELLNASLDLRRRTLGEDHPEVAQVMVDLARLPTRTPKELREAGALCGRAVAIFRDRLGVADPRTQDALSVRAMLLTGKGAETWTALVDAAVPMMLTQVQESDYPQEIGAVIAETRRLANAGDLDGLHRLLARYRVEATEELRRLWASGDHEAAAAEMRRHYAPLLKNPVWGSRVPFILSELGRWLEGQKECDEVVEALYTEGVRCGREHPGKQGETYAFSAQLLGDFLRNHGRGREAEGLYVEALEIRRRTAGPDHADVGLLLGLIASLRHERGDDEAAEPPARECVEFFRRTRPRGDLGTAEALSLLGAVRQGRGDTAEAEALFRESLELKRARLLADDWRVKEGESLLGACLVAQRRFEEAEPLLTGAHRALSDDFGVGDRRTRQAAERLSKFYTLRGKPELAATLTDPPTAPGPDSPDPS